MNKNLLATLITVGVLLYVFVPAFVWGTPGMLAVAIGTCAAAVIAMLWQITREMLD